MEKIPNLLLKIYLTLNSLSQQFEITLIFLVFFPTWILNIMLEHKYKQ